MISGAQGKRRRGILRARLLKAKKGRIRLKKKKTPKRTEKNPLSYLKKKMRMEKLKILSQEKENLFSPPFYTKIMLRQAGRNSKNTS